MTVKKYVKRPVEIEAIQYTGEITQDIVHFTSDHTVTFTANGAVQSLLISTLEGVMTASVGDYIIKGIKGEIYPCKPDIFNESYQEVT